MAASCIIDWFSKDNEILINPRTPEEEKETLIHGLQTLEHMEGHLWIATSGSSGKIKWTALSKEAVMSSANAVNRHIQANQNDIWINALPSFHVGGQGILCRAYLSHSKVISYEGRWNPCQFVYACATAKATLTSLVPTQVYDIVAHSLKAPPSLRAVIVGGGALSSDI